jgi:hypothetical protein
MHVIAVKILSQKDMRVFGMLMALWAVFYYGRAVRNPNE